MNLAQYRKQVQRTQWILRALVAAFLTVMLWTNRLSAHPAADLMLGMGVGGAFMGLLVIARNGRALKDDKLLRRLYAQKHDERLQAIRARAGMPMLLYASLAMIAAAIIAAPYNETVMCTLLIAALAQLLAGVIVKIHGLRTM